MKKAIFAMCVILASYSVAAEKQQLGAHFRSPDDAAMRVIEEKCLVCHNRQRIDEAMRKEKDLKKIQRMMEKKGAALTPKDREVLGHFWKQNPLKEKRGPAKRHVQ